MQTPALDLGVAFHEAVASRQEYAALRALFELDAPAAAGKSAVTERKQQPPKRSGSVDASDTAAATSAAAAPFRYLLTAQCGRLKAVFASEAGADDCLMCFFHAQAARFVLDPLFERRGWLALLRAKRHAATADDDARIQRAVAQTAPFVRAAFPAFLRELGKAGWRTDQVGLAVGTQRVAFGKGD
jgi:hypothetical protein